MGKVTAKMVSLQGDKYIGQPYSQMDCQALVEKMLADAGVHMDLAGSNAWFRKMTWVGTPEDCKRLFGEVPVGAFLFIWKQDGGEVQRGYTDGKGNATHIGVKTGRTQEDMQKMILAQAGTHSPAQLADFTARTGFGDGAIHSSSSRGCVCTSAFHDKSINGGWNRVGLWEALDYENPRIDAFFGEPMEEIQNDSGTEEKTMSNAIVESHNGLGVNLRSEKSTAPSAFLMKIPEGAEVTVTGADGDWYSVEYAGRRGWAMREFIRLTGEAAPVEDTGENDSAAMGGEITLTMPKETAYYLYYALGRVIGENGGAVG